MIIRKLKRIEIKKVQQRLGKYNFEYLSEVLQSPYPTSYQESPDAIEWNVPWLTALGLMSKLKY